MEKTIKIYAFVCMNSIYVFMFNVLFFNDIRKYENLKCDFKANEREMYGNNIIQVNSIP